MNRYQLCFVFWLITLAPEQTTGQTLSRQTFSITNSSNAPITYLLSAGKRQWKEMLAPYITRQYTTLEPYQITLVTAANSRPVQATLSPPNKYAIQWDGSRWVVVNTGRFN